ncbi:hypothetical protein G9A89_003679 [Geosiphon pyriformis]|nr:hypothetical protein G9A89_003679 [Geosiphon pyriformis]
MTTTRAKSKKTTLDICLKISNKISIRRALFVVEATRQNVLEAFPLPSNCDKLPLIATKATFSSLVGFSPVKVSSKRHTWVSLSVASTPTKSPKVFNNRLVNKLVFLSIASTSGAASTSFSKKMVKKTKSLDKWKQSLVSAIVTPNPFVVPNEILDEISIALSGTSSKMDQDQLLAVLPNMVSFVSGATFGGAWETITSRQRFVGWVASTLVLGAIFKIKLAYVKTVFQSVHSFLGAKSVSKDNVKLFCVEFASQQSLDAAFLVELTSSVYLTTLKIAKFLVVSESGSFFAAVALHNVPLDVFATNIKLALSVFGSITCVVLKPAGIWQYVVIYFEKLNSAVSALKHWSILVGKNSVRILSLIGGQTCFIPRSPGSGYRSQFALVTFDSQGNLNSAVVKTSTLRKCHIWWKTPGCWHCFMCQKMSHLAVDCKIFPPSTPKILKVFKFHFVGSASYAKTATSSGLSEFPSLVALSAASTADSVVDSRLDSLKKQISDLAALVKSIVEPIGSLVALVSCLLDDNAVKAVQVEKNIISMKSAANNFAKFMVGVSKDIACLRSEVDFGDIDYDSILAAKPSFLSEGTVEHVIAL